MSDISNQVLYHVIAYSAKNVDDEDILYIFTNAEAATNKAKELHKKDKEAFEFLKRKNERYTKELCDKYDVTGTSQYNIEEEVYDLATEEEYEEYHDLWLDLNSYDYENFDHYVYEYEIDDTGYVTCKGGCFGLGKKDNE